MKEHGIDCLTHLIITAPEVTLENLATVAAEPAEPVEPAAPPGWDPLVPLRPAMGPRFPVEVLPPWLRDYVLGLATDTQTPLDLAGVLVLAGLAATAGGRVTVLVRPGWSEPVNLYAVVALPPATRKSAVFRAVVRPLEDWEQSQRDMRRAAIEAAHREHDLLTARYRALTKKAVKAKPGQRRQVEAEAHTCGEELAAHRVPPYPRLLAQDVTPEELVRLLAEQDGRLALLSAEADPLDILGGRYSQGDPNLGAVLQAHAGDTIRVDRVGRPPNFIRDPALTLALTIQTEVLAGLARRREFRGRGLLARILFAVPPSGVGTRHPAPPPMPVAVAAGYSTGMAALLEDLADTEMAGRPTPHVLRFDPEARASLEGLLGELEPRLAPPDDLAPIQDWAGKLTGAVARLTGLLHVADRVADPAPWATPIAASTVARAIALGRYFLAHAEVAFGMMGADPAVAGAERIVTWLRARAATSFTRRDAHAALRASFPKAVDLDGPLALLVDHAYLRKLSPAPRPPGKPGQNPSPTYEVNPAVLAQNPRNPRNPRNPEDVDGGTQAPGPPPDSVDSADSVKAEPASTARATGRHGETCDCRQCLEDGPDLDVGEVAAS